MTIGGQFYEDNSDGSPYIFSPKTGKKKMETSEGEAEEYRSLVRDFVEYRRNFDGFWTTVEEAYRQRKYEPTWTDKDALAQLYPGRVYRIVHMTEASVFSNSLKFFLQGYNPRVGDSAVRVCEDLVNADWETESALTREIRLVARDASKYGIGWALTSFECDFEKERKEDTRPEARAMAVEDPTQAAALESLEAQMAVAEMAGAEELRTPTFEMDSRVLRGDIVTRRISPWLVGFDPEATCAEDLRYIFRFIYAPLEAVKSYDLFENTEELEPTSRDEFLRAIGRTEDDNTVLKNFAKRGDRVLIIELFERNLTTGGWELNYVPWNGGKLLRRVESPYWFGHPFRACSWNFDGDSMLPQSDILPVYSEILAERLLLTKAIDGFAREQADTTIYDKRAIPSETNLYTPADPEIGKWIGVDVPTGLPGVGAVVAKLQKDSKSPEVLNFLSIIERSIMTSSGFSPNQLGQPLKSDTSAGEAQNIAAAASAAQAHKLGGMELFLSQVAFQRLALACQFYKPPRVAKILGSTASDVWATVQWTEADVQNGLRVAIRPGATQPVSDAVRAQQCMTVIQLVANSPIAPFLVKEPRLWEVLLRAIGFNRGSDVMVPLTDQQVEQLNQMILALKMGGGGSTGSSAAPPSAPSSEAGAAQA